MRPVLLLSPALLLALACAQAAVAQTTDAAADDRRGEQRIERVHIEDAGSSVDELRYGGQTESITVQPKNNAPEYEVQPQQGARSSPTRREGDETSTGGTGPRVWKVFKF
ncbi:hypothetical protein PY257_07475 [Ramlibacter sp. H39-3-26]|uniref:hypothetical protein n=1 Tax=Curvibacter soli TaxID=3031331 RepID=UPI0023DBAD6A|nr:hypothetical protein [Ramlibacter sp. H39-3-26]MDF1485023.1 hypothetical protein [Ramlibacter sp. H39-3-26]